MTTFHIPADISGDIGGQPFKFAAGEVTPADDAEHQVLTYLVENGHLTGLDAEPKSARRASKPKE